MSFCISFTSHNFHYIRWLLNAPLLMPCLAFGFFSKFFAQPQKLESTVDVTSGATFGCDFESSIQKYNFRYILSLLNASLLMHQLFSVGNFSKSFDTFNDFYKLFVRWQKLESVVDVASDVIFRCDFKSSFQKYNFRYILSLLNASLLVHQYIFAGYFSKSFCPFQWQQRLAVCL